MKDKFLVIWRQIGANSSSESTRMYLIPRSSLPSHGESLLREVDGKYLNSNEIEDSRSFGKGYVSAPFLFNMFSETDEEGEEMVPMMDDFKIEGNVKFNIDEVEIIITGEYL